MFWCIPTWCGDYRLEKLTDTTCELTVVKPTAPEREVLKQFVKEAHAKEWLPPIRIRAKMDVAVVIEAPIKDVGPALVQAALGDEPLWSAVRSKGGTISLEESTPAALEGVAAVATVRKPRRGCPPPEPATRRASEVLRAFCTRNQYSSFSERGFMAVKGHVTGMRYFLYHRDEAARRGLGHCLLDSNGTELCIWDDRVPPEEEALALKLVVEHREHYILDHRTVRSGMRTAVWDA